MKDCREASTEKKSQYECFRDQNAPGGRLLVFIVAFNAEKTIEKVVQRIPESLCNNYEVEVLIIDDSSEDNTFKKSVLLAKNISFPFEIRVLTNLFNQGYGGNQKIGYHYALVNNYDWVALIHGDGQYAPENLPELMKEMENPRVDVVFGSRMMNGLGALKGGMPLYKYLGNKVLTRLQNYLLNSNFSEFHSGYRLYATEALRKVPFELNSNDYHFDTEIIIQLLNSGANIKEIPIPTYYGEEICYVNGMKYAWNVLCASLQAKAQRYHILYDKKFDCSPKNLIEQVKLDPLAIKSQLLRGMKDNSRILVIGNIDDEMERTIKEQGHRLVVERNGLFNSTLSALNNFDSMLILDDTEISQQPEKYVQKLRKLCVYSPNIFILVAVGNIGFILTRLLLMIGRFSYTKRGIINLEHSRLFTLRSLKKLFSQNKFLCLEESGLPIQYGNIFLTKRYATALQALHRFMIFVRPSLFSYQLLLKVIPAPSLEYLLRESLIISKHKSKPYVTSSRSRNLQ